MIVDTILIVVSTLFLIFIETITFIGLVGVIFYLIKSRVPDIPSPNIKFIMVDDKASVPERGTKKSAGYDLKSNENCTIPPRSHKAIKTGIKVKLPKNTYGRIASRSGLSFKHGIEVGAGVIDEDYKNELMVILHNHSDNEFVIEKNHRIAQLIVEHVIYPITLVENVNGEITTTSSCIREIRGLGGFGSTGIN